MGAAQSHPRWDRQYPAGWDEWGYVPPGAVKPSQHIWSEWYRDGRPNVASSGDNSYPVIFGNPDDVMQNFGKFNMTASKMNTANWAQFFAVASDPVYSPMDDPNRCTPETFPNCSMVLAQQQTPHSITTFKNNATLVGPHLTPGVAGKQIDIFSRWNNVVGDMYQKYEGHGFDYVYDINSNDTSGYDPCDQPTLFEVLVPLTLASGATYALAKYGDPILSALPTTCTPVLLLSTFVTMWEYGRGSVNVFINPDLHHSSMQKAATAMSMGLTYTLGAWSGDYYSNQISFNPNPYFEPLGGVSSMYLLIPQLQPKLALALTASSFGGIGLALVSTVWWAVSRFLCGLLNWGADACEDSKTNPDARRWDVASLCARLTDYACESEGWARSDPRAEFVFRSLMTNFDWMFAASVNPGAGTMYEQANGANPVGNLVQPQTNETAVWDPGYAWKLTFTETLHSVNPDSNDTSWNGIDSNTSYFACQNFDTLFCNSDEQGTCNSAGDNGATRQFSQNMRNWLDAAINKAYDPNNLAKMTQIPGWSNKKTRFDYDITTYLATCNKDFDEEAGTGFNDVRSRGEWAQDCDMTKVEASVAKTTVLANSFFAEKSLTDACDAVLAAKWNDQNMIAWAHYIYYRKGIYQTDDFERWLGAGDKRVDLLWDKPNHGFSADPTDASGSLRELPKILEPLMPSTKLLQPLENELQPLTNTTPAPTLLLRQQLSPVSGGDWSKWRSFCETLLELMTTKGALAAVTYYNAQMMYGLDWKSYNFCEISADDAGVFNVVAALSMVSPVSQAYYQWYYCFQEGGAPVPPPWFACSGGKVEKQLSDAYLVFGAKTWIADSATFAQLLPEQQEQVQEWLGGHGLTQPFEKLLLPLTNEQTLPDKLLNPLSGLLQPIANLLAPLTNVLQPLTNTTPALTQLEQQALTPATGGDWQTWHNFVTQLLSIYQQQSIYYAKQFYENNKSSGVNWEHLSLCEISAADDGVWTAMKAIIDVSTPSSAFQAWYVDYYNGNGAYAPAWWLCSPGQFFDPVVQQEYKNAFTFNAAQTFIANSNFYEQLTSQQQQIITQFLNRGD